jgi:transcriptional regulator with XRE-family HTH domain
MTWVPIPNAVRKLREAAKLEQRELAKKSGLTERAIRLLESKGAPKTMYAATVKALAGTLKCAPEDLATWVARRRGHDVDDEIQSIIALPPASTLARRAQREQELNPALPFSPESSSKSPSMSGRASSSSRSVPSPTRSPSSSST